jgi:hypothetical protein
MGEIIPKLRASAKGQCCTFAIPGICNNDPETVVLCHIRDEWKGMANKANDWSAAFGCSECHTAIDQRHLRRGDELFYSLRAMQRTHAKWFEMGLMTFPVTEHRARQSEKILARRPIARTAT